MKHSNLLIAAEVSCFIALVAGGLVLGLGFLLDIPVNKNLVGLSIISGWLATALAFLLFLVVTAAWLAGKAPWYWRSLFPLNFSLVIFVVALLRYNKNMGFVEPLIVVALAFFVGYFIFSKGIHQRRAFVVAVVPAFIPMLGYQVPLFMGALFGLISTLGYFSKIERQPE